MSTIPLSVPTIKSDDIDRLRTCFDNNFVGIGPTTVYVQERLSRFFSTHSCRLLNSGSSAILIALKAVGVRPGDEVIVSAYCCMSVYNQILNAGARAVLAQPREGSFFNSIESFTQNLSANTKAILFYHPFGHFDRSIEDLTKLGVPVIEDVTHTWQVTSEKKAGLYGDLVISSTGSTKFITSGTGGIVAARSPIHTEAIDVLLDYDYLTFATDRGVERYNFQLGELNAALLGSQLDKLSTFVAARRRIAATYLRELPNCFPLPPEDTSVYFRFFVQCTDARRAASIVAGLGKKGIGSTIGGFVIPDLIFGNDSIARDLHSRLVAIPVYPSLSDSSVHQVVQAVKEL